MRNELWRLSAVDLAKAIADRAISSREAVQSSLDRTAAVNPAINAIVQVLEQEALAAADAADAAVKSGAPLGRLHGVPVTTKVNVDQRGCATTNGVVAFRDVIADEDSPLVANLRKAGAVIIGRTNTPAFSHRWFSDNDLHGTTRNPWSDGLTPGGSSGGAAAAVSSGMGALAHGNDFGGSVRYPAYACGVAGLRPTPGRVPAFNPSATAERPISAQLMSVQGPLAFAISDVRLGLAAMAAGDVRDPNWVPAPLQGPSPVKPVRAAIVPNPFGETAPEVQDAIRTAGRWLADAGYVVEETAPPRLMDANDLWHGIVINEERRGLALAVHKFGDHRSRYNIDAHLAYAPHHDGDGVLALFEQRLGLMREWQLFMARYPVIVMPVSDQLPFRQGQDQEDADTVRKVIDAQRPLLAVAALGFPAVSVPTGVVRGTPVGVQIVSGKFREDIGLDAAEAIEVRAKMPRPPMWS